MFELWTVRKIALEQAAFGRCLCQDIRFKISTRSARKIYLETVLDTHTQYFEEFPLSIKIKITLS